MSAIPYPSDTRAKGWRFELDLERIERSDTWALTPADLRPWLLMLWSTAWQQEPCGSLPANDELIAARIGMKTSVFVKNRDKLMRGWWLADDGRLYHNTIVELVLAMEAVRNKTNDRKKLYTAKFERIRDRDGCACVYCGATKYLSLDHLIAVSRGGGGEDQNLVTACRGCNSKKGARTPDEAGLSFVNKAAEQQWHELRAERSAFGSFGNEMERGGNAFGTRSERGHDGTGTGTGTGSKPKTEGTNDGVRTASRASTCEGALSAAEISTSLREWERERGKAVRNLTPSQQQVIDLAGMSVTSAELRKAYDLAVEDRENDNDPGPINASFVRTKIERVRRPPRASPASNGQRSYHDDRADTIAELTGRKRAHDKPKNEVIDVELHAVSGRLGA
ncbi:HNH endonuclease [Burkholderia cenocepacia]|uniref:HNH endonuclease n=1 Tax=Burkholderia cenocepacia TaxID=95486 RepID=UPI001B9862B8|nr:HNH endonuclease [Burkholderia cenocepacia]